jgi:hypothetical protein
LNTKLTEANISAMRVAVRPRATSASASVAGNSTEQKATNGN